MHVYSSRTTNKLISVFLVSPIPSPTHRYKTFFDKACCLGKDPKHIKNTKSVTINVEFPPTPTLQCIICTEGCSAANLFKLLEIQDAE